MTLDELSPMSLTRRILDWLKIQETYSAPLSSIGKRFFPAKSSQIQESLSVLEKEGAVRLVQLPPRTRGRPTTTVHLSHGYRKRPAWFKRQQNEASSPGNSETK